MAVKTGKVIKVSGNEALVEIMDHSSCSGCGGCGASNNNKDNTIWTKNYQDANVRDFVQIELTEKTLLKVSALVYIVPVISLLIGLIIGHYYADANNLPENLVGLISGLLLMSISFLVINIIDRKTKDSSKLKPKITRKIPG
ncbi:SoxR reducing system RseC family protein [Natranaerofaba carboxydovora]|uniref:SoxR reducing system RseC family protein n=1 Tax=Natranaerofaba carboxydovora TaxID=2742683 RepID=UPI001F1441F3|nr:SoxR reducing system RseC family protein [Natranaerofaba carboxydovora]UMZ73572.1 Positive regulator of sigma(E), RseC/MucC [Natranaerofaba carboxydovora]